jgi:dienelactone hydrolase
MVSNKQETKIAVVVIHEIYGVNQHMNSFCETLRSHNFDVFCPALFTNESVFNYSQEQIAYDNFITTVGFINAKLKVSDFIRSIKRSYAEVFLVGFSVGATIAWLCSVEDEVSGVVGYYGSRIRDYVEVEPGCPTLLFFPFEERSFLVDDLIEKLTSKNSIAKKFSGAHGFSDPYSSHYNEESAKRAFSDMIDFIKRISSN